MKMKPDDAYALRMALEPLTQAAVAEADKDEVTIDIAGIEMALTSIAISAKRIADSIKSLKKNL